MFRCCPISGKEVFNYTIFTFGYFLTQKIIHKIKLDRCINFLSKKLIKQSNFFSSFATK